MLVWIQWDGANSTTKHDSKKIIKNGNLNLKSKRFNQGSERECTEVYCTYAEQLFDYWKKINVWVFLKFHVKQRATAFQIPMTSKSKSVALTSTPSFRLWDLASHKNGSF